MSQSHRLCVCVPPWTKGFSTTFAPQAGGRSAIASLLPTKTLAIGSETRPDQSGVPAFNTMTPLVHPAAVSLFPWFFMLPPPNRFSHRRFAADLPLCRRALLLTTICSNIYNCADFPPYRLSHSFPREIALTENPSSKCVLLSRPTRVLSVNPFTGALFFAWESKQPNAPPITGTSQESTDPTLNQLPHWPPGQKTVLEEYIGNQTLRIDLFTPSNHVHVSCFCHFHAAITLSTELKVGHASFSA